MSLNISVSKYSVTSEDDYCDANKIYITVTTLPSLSNCTDCRSVAYEHRDEGKVALKLPCFLYGNKTLICFQIFPDFTQGIHVLFMALLCTHHSLCHILIRD